MSADSLRSNRVLLSVEQYQDEVTALVEPLATTEHVPLAAAVGRVLARDLTSRWPLPAFDASNMDGYAVRHHDLLAGVALQVVGEVHGGSPLDPPIGPGQAVRIMTGAPLPSDADTVVQLEVTETLGSAVSISEIPEPGANVRRAGTYLRAGDHLLSAGTQVTAEEMAALAAAGFGAVEVIRRPVVAIVATGDELVEPADQQELTRGQVFESNASYLRAAVLRAGAIAGGFAVFGDDPTTFAAGVRALAEGADLVVFSGGVSVGDRDVVRIGLPTVGDATFRHVAVQPGRPQGWGLIDCGDRRVPALALPGNPLSTVVSFEQFVRPVLDKMLGRDATPWTTAVAETGWRTPARRDQVVPVRIRIDETGRQCVSLTRESPTASHALIGLIGADALAWVPAQVDQVAPGDLVRIRRLA